MNTDGKATVLELTLVPDSVIHNHSLEVSLGAGMMLITVP